MIISFKHKGLKGLYETGRSRLIGADYKRKCEKILTALEVADNPEEMNIVGFGFHPLQGSPQRYSVKVNKNFRITFGWRNGAVDIELEDYH